VSSRRKAQKPNKTARFRRCASCETKSRGTPHIAQHPKDASTVSERKRERHTNPATRRQTIAPVRSCAHPPGCTLHRMSLQEIAPAAPQAVTSTTKPHREKRISKRLRQAIVLLESGECKTQKAAAERAGLNDQYLSRALGQVEIQAFIARQRARNIARGTLRASARIADLVDAQSEHVAMHASRLLLETSGDLRSSAPGGVNVQINNNVQAGYVIDLTDHTKSPDLVSPDSERNEP
jgi:hypothetical protein